MVNFLEKVERCGKWPPSVHSDVFLDSECHERASHCTSTRWQERHRVEWDATDGRNRAYGLGDAARNGKI